MVQRITWAAAVIIMLLTSAARGELPQQTISRHGTTITEPVQRAFGDGGIEALGSLSPAYGRKLAMTGPYLIQSPHAPLALQIVAQEGDAAAEYLYRNRLMLHREDVVLRLIEDQSHLQFLPGYKNRPAANSAVIATVSVDAQSRPARIATSHGASKSDQYVGAGFVLSVAVVAVVVIRRRRRAASNDTIARPVVASFAHPIPAWRSVESLPGQGLIIDSTAVPTWEEAT